MSVSGHGHDGWMVTARSSALSGAGSLPSASSSVAMNSPAMSPLRSARGQDIVRAERAVRDRQHRFGNGVLSARPPTGNDPIGCVATLAHAVGAVGQTATSGIDIAEASGVLLDEAQVDFTFEHVAGRIGEVLTDRHAVQGAFVAFGLVQFAQHTAQGVFFGVEETLSTAAGTIAAAVGRDVVVMARSSWRPPIDGRAEGPVRCGRRARRPPELEPPSR